MTQQPPSIGARTAAAAPGAGLDRITAEAGRQGSGPLEGFTPDKLVDLYRAILLPRLIEERMLLLLRQGKLAKWFSGIGQEAIAVGVTAALDEDDWILPMHRNLGVFTGRGVDLGRLFMQLFGRDGGFTKGRDRTFHFGILEKRIVGMISHLGANMPVADGLALAAQLRGERRVAAAFTGEGATSEGDFYEAVNLAAVWRLPVIFVIENNGYGLSTPVSEQYATERLADRGTAWGVPGFRVDGNDLLAVHRAVSDAARRARRGEGATILEFMTFRMRGHEEASGTAYVPKHLFDEWGARDPVLRFEKLLQAERVLTEQDLRAIKQETKARIEELVDRALAAPESASTPEQELADVYAGPRAAAADGAGAGAGLESRREGDIAGRLKTADPPGGHEIGIRAGIGLPAGAVARDASGAEKPGPAAGEEVRYVDAISDGLRIAMTRDSRIVLLGQDIAEYGGVFKVTEGFLEEFGRERVRNTPIVESAALGTALGLALDGFHPMVEMQFADFISCGFNQLVNNLAKTHYRWGAPVPVVVRCPVGGGVGAGPFHSQNIEAWFTHVAGLKVVAPATPHDAKGLLLAAFEDANPVLYLEHKFLYRIARGKVPAGAYTVPIGIARVARAGSDATIVTWGAGVGWAIQAAEALDRKGRRVEVIDLRSLQPWDRETVLASAARTGRVLVLHEAPLTGGFGAEVAAVVGREAFPWLDAPVARLGALDTPVPFSHRLEAIHSPKSMVLAAIEDLLAY